MDTYHHTLHATIMRRVWYSFGIQLVTFPPLWYGIVFGVSLGLFRELVFVRSVIDNFLAVPVGNVPGFLLAMITNALASGEFLTLATVAVMVTTIISLVRRITVPLMVGRTWQAS